MNYFVSNINWTALWWIFGVVALLWTGLAELPTLFPAFAPYYRVISGFLIAAQTAAAFAARGGKFVVNRSEPPQDGKPGYGIRFPF